MQYFSLVMWPLGADARPLGTLRASPSLIPAAHNTAAAAERGGGPVGCVDVKMCRRGREGVNISENVGQGNQVRKETTSGKLGRGAWLSPINK